MGNGGLRRLPGSFEEPAEMGDGCAPQRFRIGWPVCAIEVDLRVSEDEPGRVSAGHRQMDVRVPAAFGKIPQQLFSETNQRALPVVSAIVKRTQILQASDARALSGPLERRLASGGAPRPDE